MSTFLLHGFAGPAPLGKTMRRFVSLAWLSLLAVGSIRGDEPAAVVAPQSKVLQALYRADAETYEFFADAAHTRPLAREPQPVLHWASPNDWSGDIFVWTDGGRPEIVGSVFSGPAGQGGRRFYHEFHALRPAIPIPQSLPDGRRWEPTSAGLVFAAVPGAAVPADSEKARLTQMRALVREFEARTRFNGSEWELRLLPQPMYRYQRPAGETPAGGTPATWLDGAIFAYVLTTGTDAEVLLVLEARRTEQGARWEYAPARITNRPAWIRRQDKELWRVEEHSEQEGIIGPYTLISAGGRTADELKAAAEETSDPPPGSPPASPRP